MMILFLREDFIPKLQQFEANNSNLEAIQKIEAVRVVNIQRIFLKALKWKMIKLKFYVCTKLKVDKVFNEILVAVWESKC